LLQAQGVQFKLVGLGPDLDWIQDHWATQLRLVLNGFVWTDDHIELVTPSHPAKAEEGHVG
jgi:hypothetical protein